MYLTHVLLHISVFLFFWAISEFFYTVHHLFGLVAHYALVASAIVYTLLSISPLIFSDSPYNTPMTPPLRAGFIVLGVIFRLLLCCLRLDCGQLTGLSYYKGIHFDRVHLYSIKAREWAEKLEPYAMEWLFTQNDFSDNDMDKFLEGLPGYMSSSHTKKHQLDQYLTTDHILSRVMEHLIACATSVELSDEAGIGRVSSCVKALCLIFQYSRKYKEEVSGPEILKEELQLQRRFILVLMDNFQVLCDMDDPTVALRASCIRALAFQGLLSQLVPQDSKATASPPFPVLLAPVYQFFFPNNYTDAIQQLGGGHTPSPLSITEMRRSLLHDGPLANLTILAQAVRDKEHASPSTLSFCWKTLDMLLTQLGTIHSEEPTPTQIDFDNFQKDIRTYVHDEERGFRVTPLLDILDIVARGRRLLMVLSGHPKYHNRADIVFGKEYLRNGDLLKAFAHCLPHFISNNSPEVCREFMEKVIHSDDLWTSLQVNLWNAEKSNIPTPDKLRIFEDCCIVIDLAFSVLEDSREVNWRASEFGSLAQHFESFITHYFQGAFMGRSTSFRVGVIKARFCNAILAQFSNDIEREGTVSFRSQWDVASLARLIFTLGLRDKEDADFWNSYVNGGHIGPEFSTKAHEMIEITACDGPLLIFCQLGHFTSMAVPIEQSGLNPREIQRVWELQTKLIENKRLPLNRASETVWEALCQLREQVIDLCDKNKGEDKEILQRLLQTIDDVWSLRISGEEGPSQSEPTEEQDPKTSVAVNSTSSSGGLRGIGSRSSFAFESTAVTGVGSGGKKASDGEDYFGSATSLLIPRAFTDLEPERSTDKVLDGERKAYGRRSESPQSYDSGSHSPPSPLPTTQATPIGTPPPTISPVMPYFPFVGDPRQRRVNTSTTLSSKRRTGSGLSATWPNLETAESTPGRDAPTILPNPAIVSESPRGSFDLRDEGQSGASPTFEKG